MFIFFKIYILSPFQVGQRENFVDFLLPKGEENYIISPKDTFYSTLSKNGKIFWKEAMIDEEGYIKINVDTIEIKRHYNHHGFSFMALSYIYIDTFLNEGFYLLFPERIHRFYIDSNFFYGNPYHYSNFPIPLYLKEKRYRILLVTHEIDGKVRLRFLRAPNFPFIYKDLSVLPDIIKDSTYDFHIGFCIINPTDIVYENLVIKAYADNLESEKKIIKNLLPFEILYEDMKFRILNKNFNNKKILISLSLEGKDFDTITNLYLDIKTKDEPIKITFKSKIDNSIQYFSVLFPKFKGNYKKGTLFTLHGAGVEASDFIKAYRQKDSFFIVAPTNRRPYGFDWQDLGMLDFLEVMNLVKNSFDVDTNKFYLKGHSMGGHGVYFLGFHFADKFAGLIPSAGWVSFRTYVPYTLQRINLFGNPEQIKIREKILYSEDIQKFLRNALNLPIFIIHGSEDKIVPVFHSRFMFSLLKENKVKVKFHEVENMGHWWDIEETEGIDCVDSDSVMNFIKGIKKILPDSFEFHFSDLGLRNTFYFLKIHEPEKFFYPGYIKFKRKDKEIFINTKNILVFEIDLSIFDFDKFNLHLDGKNFVFKGKSKLVFVKKKEWEVLSEYKVKGRKRGFNNPGLIKNILRRGILIIFESKDKNSSFLNFHFARNLSFFLLTRANMKVKIIPDTLFDKRFLLTHNIILVGKRENFSKNVKDLIDSVPWYVFEKNNILNNLLIFVYPVCYFNCDKMVLFVSYSDVNDLKEALRIPLFVSGIGLPDGIFMKSRFALREKGFSGLGYFLFNNSFTDFEEVAFPD
ncbi:MAG: prolyl oligopeptidase family serine peptidase [Candidatus Hydrothermales bacterium]